MSISGSETNANLGSSIVGFVRSLGKLLPLEQITLNAVCPNVVKTNFSPERIYNRIEAKQLLTTMESVVAAFEVLLGSNDLSGELLEVGPNGGYHIKPPVPWLDKESKECLEMTFDLARISQQPRN
jgi:hypothetical protein